MENIVLLFHFKNIVELSKVKTFSVLLSTHGLVFTCRYNIVCIYHIIIYDICIKGIVL